jgi:hypothetical protein
MSDAYGVGNSLMAFHHSMVMASRRTGRTSRMVESLKDGDRVVVASSGMKRYLADLIRKTGKKVDVIVLEPHDNYRLSLFGTSVGKTYFDNDWVEKYYKHELENISKNLRRMEEKVSGYGLARQENRFAARKLSQYPSEDYLYHNGYLDDSEQSSEGHKLWQKSVK